MTKTRDAELADPTFTDRTIAILLRQNVCRLEAPRVLDRVRALLERAPRWTTFGTQPDFLYGDDGLPQ